MANLQVKDIDEGLYESLRSLATNEKRSISQEVVYILQKYLSKPKEFDPDPTDEFLQLAGSWKDERDSDEIIADIRNSRRNSERFGRNNELWAPLKTTFKLSQLCFFSNNSRIIVVPEFR